MVQKTILRLPAVKARTGLSRTSIYNGVKQGTFPHHIELGPRAVGWVSTDIDGWIADRIAASSLIRDQSR